MKLLGLDNYCFSEWWATKAKGETMIVQPKIDGCGLGLKYQSGRLVEAYTRSGEDVTEAARTIFNIPLDLPEDGPAVSEEPIEICGELYGIKLIGTKSKILASEHLKNRHSTGYGLGFVAYEILNSIENEIDDIKKLENWFFEIPPTTWTDDPKQIKRWHREWLAGKLYENLPTDGIVVKVNSTKTKQRLGVNLKTRNWSLALK